MVDIKTIVLKNNLEDILKLYEYCTKMNFEFLSISFLRNNNLKQNSSLYDSFDEIFYKPNYNIEKYRLRIKGQSNGIDYNSDIM